MTRTLAWPGLALAGVVLLTEPWQGRMDAVGLLLAALAAIAWAGYILFMTQVGDRFDGVSGLSLTVPIAALTAAAIGIPEAARHLDLRVVATGFGLALLLPVLPYALEILALGRMTQHAFGTLMALEPAFAALLGLIVLHQQPSILQIVGVVLVVAAGAGAQRSGRRNGGGGPRPVDDAHADGEHEDGIQKADEIVSRPLPEVPSLN